MRPRFYHLMDLLIFGGSLAFLSYICGGSAIAGIIGALLYGIFGVLLIFQIRKMWRERKK